MNNKKYHIPKQQIRSLRVVEPLILRWFGYVQLKVDNIGMSSKHSSVILYPVIRRDKVDDLLNSYLQEFELQPLSHRPNKASALGYILIPSLKFLMVIGILMFLWIYSAYLLLFLPIVVLLNFLKWKYSALSFNNRFITIRYGKGLRVVTLITHKKYVETTSIDQTILMRRKRTIHYIVALYSEQLEEVYCVKYLRDRFKKMFMDYIL
ncbi:PH domain-containing protein [Bacillus licheniformis]|uniref:PH domain-containing protein n=1 Tax=Bacillus licheniformis TaxID=1402 RepID=UPI003BF6BA19